MIQHIHEQLRPWFSRTLISSNVASDTDMPPFDKAAIDGYTCRRTALWKVELVPRVRG